MIDPDEIALRIEKKVYAGDELYFITESGAGDVVDAVSLIVRVQVIPYGWRNNLKGYRLAVGSVNLNPFAV